MSTISINRCLSCLSLQPVCEKHRKLSLQKKSIEVKTCEQFICIFFPQGVQQRSVQLYCLFTKINRFARLERAVESEVFGWGICKLAVLQRLCPLENWAPPGPKTLLTPPELLTPAAAAAAAASFQANQILPTLSVASLHHSNTRHSRHTETSLWTDWFPRITWPPPAFGSLYFYLALPSFLVKSRLWRFYCMRMFKILVIILWHSCYCSLWAELEQNLL